MASRAATTPGTRLRAACSPRSQYVRTWRCRLQSVPVPHPEPRSRRAAARAGPVLGARLPRSRRCHRACTRTGCGRARGRPPARPRRAQVWVPQAGGPAPSDAEFLAALPRLRLVQLLSAGAERFAGRLPEGVVLCNARGAHTPGDGGVGDGRHSSPPSAASRTSSASRRPAAGRFSTQRSLVGARVLVVGAGDIGRTVGRMLDGLRRRAHLRRPHRPGRRPVGRRAARAAAAGRRRRAARAGDARDDGHGRRRVPRRDARRRAAGQRRPRRRRRHRRPAGRARERAGCGPPST